MQIIMNSSIAKLLNQSPLPAVIINGETSNIWYNDAYINQLKDYPTLMDALKKIFQFNEQETYSFINKKINEQTSMVFNDVKYYLMKEYRKSINFTIISIIPEIKYNFNESSTIDTEEYFFMHMPQPAVIFDFKSRKVETANIAFLKICGVPIEHIKSMYIASLFHESTHLINNYLSSSTPYTKTFLINQYNLDTNRIMIFEVIPIIKEEKNNEYKVIFMMRDIFGEIETQRDQISEDFLRYQFLTRSISDGMLIVNSGMIMDANNAACMLWRYEKDELINKSLSMLIPDAAQYIDNASTVKGCSIPFIGVRKDKTQFNGALRVQAFDNLNKKTMVYIVKDLTEHIAVARIMEEQTDFTSVIFNTQPNMIAVFNDEHMLTRCNKLFLEFFGYDSIEEAIHNIGDISSRFIDGDDRHFITSRNKDNWFLLPIENPSIEYLVGIKSAHGKYNIFSLKSTLMENETNTFYVVSFSNNAIGLIAQNTEDILTEDEEFERDDIIDMMQSIMNHIVFMSETMENFKNFFKPEDVNVPFNVVSSIKSIMSLLTPALKKSNIEVVYNMSPAMENVRVFGFVNDLKQVIMNIIVNGKEAILTRKENEPDIKGQIFINIECVDNNERVIIAIMDNGTGLTEETISKIFEMHYTTKGANGTGIGMYMAQMIIEKMNGTLKVSNRKDVDKGAIIEINMPVYKES